MAILVLAGEYSNLLARGVVSVTSEDSARPKAALSDGRQSVAYRAASAVTDLRVSVDGDLLLGRGSMESGIGFLTNISTGAGSIAEETTIVDTGSKALKLVTGASGTAAARVAVNARAGERLNVSARLRGDGTRVARLRIFNPRTNRYLKSDGTWEVAGMAADVATEATTTYTTKAVSFSVEAFSACRVPTLALHVILIATETTVGGAYVDNLALWPSWDFVSAHGTRNLGPITPKLQSSSDGSAWTTRATGSLSLPQSFYIRNAGVRDERFAGLLLEGTNFEAIELSEVWIGAARALSRAMKPGYRVDNLVDRVSNQTPYDERFVVARSSYARRIVDLDFVFPSVALFEEARDEVFGRSNGDEFPLVLVPVDTEPTCVLGRIDRSWQFRRTTITITEENTLRVVEAPFPPEEA